MNNRVSFLEKENLDLKARLSVLEKFLQIKTTSKDFKVVIKGDVSGDGVINALDLLRVQKVILKQVNLDDSGKLSADTSGDGKVNALDLLQIQKHILKQTTITQ